jgi:DNA invertase Pin-like site-specific DNA recombinase
MKIGYARVSSTDQYLSVQRERLAAAGCDPIHEEKVSGKSLAGRVELEAILSFIRPGDTLVVTRIDRLARDIGDLKKVVRALTDKGAGLQATEQPIDTTTSHGRMFLDLLGVFAEFETAIRKERQLEGIAKAKAKGVYAGKGRPRKVGAEEIRKLKAAGAGPTEIAKRLGIGRASVYRALGIAT